MNIKIESSDWGNASPTDIHRLIEDTAGQLLRHFTAPPTGQIRVSHRDGTPMVAYRASPTDEYQVFLAVRDRLWAKFAYQFSHELCHICSNYERIRQLQWFDEVLCEMASLFTISQMATTWLTSPPYANWSTYSSSLRNYVDEFVSKSEHQLPPNISLPDWFRANEESLRANAVQREKNALIAIQLLPLFQATPHHWQCIRFLPVEYENLEVFLDAWQKACPDEHKPFVMQIAQLFGSHRRAIGPGHQEGTAEKSLH